jgi:hypothetical protein
VKGKKKKRKLGTKQASVRDFVRGVRSDLFFMGFFLKVLGLELHESHLFFFDDAVFFHKIFIISVFSAFLKFVAKN